MYVQESEPLSVIEYMKSFEYTIDYFRNYYCLIFNIKTDNLEKFKSHMDDIYDDDNNFYYTELHLKGAVVRDLKGRDIEIYFQYAYDKLTDIIQSFEVTTYGFEKFYTDSYRNQKFYKAWKEYPKLNNLIIKASSPDNFIHILTIALKKRIDDFHKLFMDAVTAAGLKLVSFEEKNKHNASFWIDIFDENIPVHLDYDGFKRHFNKKDHFNIKTKTAEVKIYTAELALILSSSEIPAKNKDSNEETTIDGRYYIETYEKGYIEGQKYFEKEFAISPDTLYGANADHYIRDIHENYFNLVHPGTFVGWQHVKKSYPVIIAKKVINEYGYYSGIVSKVEEMISKYPKLFATFEKSEQTDQPLQTDNYKPELTIDQIALIYAFEGKYISKKNAFEILQKYGYTNPDSGEILFKLFNSYSIPENRVTIPDSFSSDKIKKRIELFESIIIFLNPIAKEKVIEDLNILRTTNCS